MRFENAVLNLQELRDRKLTLESRPLKIYVEPSMRCNLDCMYCIAQNTRTTRDMGMEMFHEIEKQLFPYASEVNLFLRGEPTMNAHFAEMLKVCSGYDFTTKFFSNLSYKNNWILDRMLEAGAHINVSFDGFGEHGSTRIGINESHVISNIEYLLKNSGRNEKFHLKTATVVTKLNSYTLPDLVRTMHSMGVKEMMFGCLDALTPETLTIQLSAIDAPYFEEAMKVADSLNMRLSTPTHVGGVELKKSENWGTTSLKTDKYFKKYCERVNPDVKTEFCPYPWIQTVIQCDGMVTTCCQHKLPIRKWFKGLDFHKDIWNSPLYQRYRGHKSHAKSCAGGRCNMTRYSIWGGYHPYVD